MWYPMDWERHVFDEFIHVESEKIAARVMELQNEYPKDAQDITFTPWGEHEVFSDADYDADLFNDWDDNAEQWLIDECRGLIEGKCKELTEEFVKAHWCVAVTEQTKALVSFVGKC